MDLLGKIATLRANTAKRARARRSDPGTDKSVPPGQAITQKWPVLTAGPTPRIDLATWRLRFNGLVENSLELTYEAFLALPRKKTAADFHCVTGWSRLDNEWEGVGIKGLMATVRPKPEARYAMIYCYGGYTTNLPLEALIGDDTLLAFRHNGEELSPDHGWLLRLVIPNLYSWKSAKWVGGFEFIREDEPGFWEIRGYHNNGDPWKEERFSLYL